MAFIHSLISNGLTYTSFRFFILLTAALILYYICPKKTQWYILLITSILFYICASQGNIRTICLFAVTIIVSFAVSLKISGDTDNPSRKWILTAGIIISSIPLLLIKGNAFVVRPIFHSNIDNLLVPLGVSFYTLQMISYLVDVYCHSITPEKNFLKYFLYISFFPHIMQGPIPRYAQLAQQLYAEHKFNSKTMTRGLQLIIWGFFLKYMIADKAGLFVNTVFGKWEMYQGMFVLVAGVLYSIQLYSDFLACVCICKGTAELFGIKLADNFTQPYLATSVKDFWRRWHMSLSSWLRDYIYIPLGGNRKGKLHKYINLAITFLVSGAWHGSGYQFILWGGMHAIYQISSEILSPVKEKADALLGLVKGSAAEIWCKRVFTFFFVMIAWIMFRADSALTGLKMIASIFTVHNIWVLADESILNLGLSWKEWCLLLMSIYVLLRIELFQQSCCIRDRIAEQPLFLRWALYIFSIIFIVIFGTYGFGFNAADFIYRGF